MIKKKVDFVGSTFFVEGLFYCVLSEVGSTHEVGGWHAFFACELYLVEVDVTVEDCNF